VSFSSVICWREGVRFVAVLNSYAQSRNHVIYTWLFESRLIFYHSVAIWKSEMMLETHR